jgi:hypothetical protein
MRVKKARTAQFRIFIQVRMGKRDCTGIIDEYGISLTNRTGRCDRVKPHWDNEYEGNDYPDRPEWRARFRAIFRGRKHGLKYNQTG